MRLAAFLFALCAFCVPAAAAGVPDPFQPTYAVVRARFVPKQTLLNPEGPDPYIGVKVQGDVEVRRVLAGKPGGKRFSAELWLPKMSGPLDVYLVVEQQFEGAPQIAAWSATSDGFCILPEQAIDGPVKAILRLRHTHPCRRH